MRLSLHRPGLAFLLPALLLLLDLQLLLLLHMPLQQLLRLLLVLLLELLLAGFVRFGLRESLVFELLLLLNLLALLLLLGSQLLLLLEVLPLEYRVGNAGRRRSRGRREVVRVNRRSGRGRRPVRFDISARIDGAVYFDRTIRLGVCRRLAIRLTIRRAIHAGQLSALGHIGA